jgi:hypothetical protein
MSFGKGFRYAEFKRLKVCKKSARAKSNQVNPPAINYLFSKSPLNLFK